MSGSARPGVSPALERPPRSPAGQPSGDPGLKTGSHRRLLLGGETSGPWPREERPAEPGGPPGAGSACHPCCSAGGVAGRPRGTGSLVRRDVVALSTGMGGPLVGGDSLNVSFTKLVCHPKPVRKGRLETPCRWPRLRLERSFSVYFALWSQGPRVRSGAPWGGRRKKAQWTCMGVSGLMLAAAGAGQPWADSSVLPLGLEPPRPPGSGSQRVVLTAGALGGSLCPDARVSAGHRSEGQSRPSGRVLSHSGRAVLTGRWQGGSGEDVGSPGQG